MTKPTTALQLVEQQKHQIGRALPQGHNLERFMRICMTEISRNPKLATCNARSLLGAFIQSAQLGLEPNPQMGHAYLIPFYNSKLGCHEVQFIPGYRGLMALAYRSKSITRLNSAIVYPQDTFEIVMGLDHSLVHKPNLNERDGVLTHVYSIARFDSGEFSFEWMMKSQCDEIRDSKQYKNPVWEDHYDAMARKTVIRRHCKFLPLTAEAERALVLSDQSDNGESQELRNPEVHAVDVDFSEVPDEPLKTEDATTITKENKRDDKDGQDAAKAKELDVFMKLCKDIRDLGGDALKILDISNLGEVTGAKLSDIQNANDVLDAWMREST